MITNFKYFIFFGPFDVMIIKWVSTSNSKLVYEKYCLFQVKQIAFLISSNKSLQTNSATSWVVS